MNATSPPSFNVQLLDCTLRDGAHVNGGCFGRANINFVINSLCKSRVDVVEVGFIQTGVASDPHSVYFDSFEAVDALLDTLERRNSAFAAMIRIDKFKPEHIKPCKSISMIRLAFYEEHLHLLENFILRTKAAGYSVALNPLAITTISHARLLEIVALCNRLQVDTFSLVDTFGALTLSTFEELLKLLHGSLDPKVALGLHLHENMSLGMGFIQFALKFVKLPRSMVVDGSLYGMGRNPGNVPTELIMQFFNQEFTERYSLEPTLDCLERIIIPAKTVGRWGYAPAYMLSASKGLHRSYPEYFEEKQHMSLCEIHSNLMQLTREDGARFNEESVKRLPKITAVIPVKKNSSRLPGKNILPFADCTLLEHKIKQLQQVRGVDEIVVSSDSDQMLEIGRSLGVRALKRPDDLANESRPLSDFFDYIVDVIDEGILLWACCTSPLFDETCIQKAVDLYISKVLHSQKYDSLITTYEFKHYLMDDSGPLNYKLGLGHTNSQDIPALHLFTNGALLATTRNVRKWRYNYGPNAYRLAVNQTQAIDIDTREDYLCAVALYEHNRTECKSV